MRFLRLTFRKWIVYYVAHKFEYINEPISDIALFPRIAKYALGLHIFECVCVVNRMYQLALLSTM